MIMGKGNIMKKKGICIIALLLICTNIMTVSAADVNMTEEEKVYQEYKDDEQYQKMVDDYGEAYGETFLENVVKSRLNSNISIMSGGGNECYQTVKNIMQTKDYNCGSTTTLQTLYGLNSASNILGIGDAARISSLDTKYNVESQGCMIVYQIVDALNKYNNGNQTYIYKEASGMTLNQFEDNVATSLTNCKPVVLHAVTTKLDYYYGRESFHYLSLDYINRTSDTVRIVDCNNKSAYYGVHYVPLSQAYDTIHRSDRYLIY